MGLYQECPNYSPGVKFGPAPGVTSFTLAYIGKILEISLYLAIRPRDTKFCMWPYLVGLYQMCPNYNPGVKFDPALGVTTFTWAYIGKTLEIFLYLALRPRLTKFCMQLHLVDLYQEWPNQCPGVKFGPTSGVTSFTLAYKGKTLEISLYLAIKPRVTKFCM